MSWDNNAFSSQVLRSIDHKKFPNKNLFIAMANYDLPSMLRVEDRNETSEVMKMVIGDKAASNYIHNLTVFENGFPLAPSLNDPVVSQA